MIAIGGSWSVDSVHLTPHHLKSAQLPSKSENIHILHKPKRLRKL